MHPGREIRFINLNWKEWSGSELEGSQSEEQVYHFWSISPSRFLYGSIFLSPCMIKRAPSSKKHSQMCISIHRLVYLASKVGVGRDSVSNCFPGLVKCPSDLAQDFWRTSSSILVFSFLLAVRKKQILFRSMIEQSRESLSTQLKT